MDTWLKLLPSKLDSINEWDFIEPDHALESSDQLVGEMSDMSKRLLTLGRLLEKEAYQSQLDAHYCNNKAKKLELEAKGTELQAKATVLKGLMWIGIKDEFGLWGESVIEIRTGFKVVTKLSSEDDLPPFIRRILGG